MKALLWVAVGALVAWVLHPGPQTLQGPPVVTTVERVVREEPDTVVRWRERVVYRTPEPIVREIAVNGALPDVANFCGAAGWTSDTTVVVRRDTVLLLRSVTTDPGWFLRPDRIAFVGPRSDGALAREEFIARPGWSARVHGDSVIVRSPRFGLLKQLAEAAVFVGAGWVVGRAF